MKVLITGGTGFIGQEVGKALVRSGHQVFVVSRNQEKAELLLPYPAKIIEADLLKSASDDKAFSEVDAVIHLAGENVGEGRWSQKRKERILSSREQFTKNLIQSLETNKNLQVFISASAVGIYGTGFLAEVCQKWEAAVMTLRNSRQVIFRTGVVLSPWGGALEKMLLSFRFGLGSVLGDGQQWISWIHIQDLVDIYLSALADESFSGIYDAVSPNPVTNRELTQEMARQLNKKMGPATPALALKLALGEMAEIVLESQKVIPEKLLERKYTFRFPKLSEALKDCLQYIQDNHLVYHAEQYIPLKREQIFPFFADAKNLEEITPNILNFHVQKMSTPEMQEGTIIDYRLKIHGVPTGWQTEIQEWQPNEKFVDVQKKGPYSWWHHTHRFEDLGPGTLMSDTVRYKIPLGIMGWVVSAKVIQNDIEKIFSYRRKKTRQIILTRYGNKNIQS